jgi:hypothetical protein
MMSRIPRWAGPGLREARRRADELIARRESGDPSWSDEHAQWWLAVYVPPDREVPAMGRAVHRAEHPRLIEVTAEHGRGEYVFKPDPVGGWVRTDQPI